MPTFLCWNFVYFHSLKLFTKASLVSINASSKFFTIGGLVYIDLLFNMEPVLMFLTGHLAIIYTEYFWYILGDTFFQILVLCYFLNYFLIVRQYIY